MLWRRMRTRARELDNNINANYVHDLFVVDVVVVVDLVVRTDAGIGTKSMPPPLLL